MRRRRLGELIYRRGVLHAMVILHDKMVHQHLQGRISSHGKHYRRLCCNHIINYFLYICTYKSFMKIIPLITIRRRLFTVNLGIQQGKKYLIRSLVASLLTRVAWTHHTSDSSTSFEPVLIKFNGKHEQHCVMLAHILPDAIVKKI